MSAASRRECDELFARHLDDGDLERLMGSRLLVVAGLTDLVS